jgi:hypothetical protein
MKASEKIKQILKNGNQTLHLNWLNRYAEDKLTEIEKAAFEDFVNESDDFVLKTAIEGLKENSYVTDLENIRQTIKNSNPPKSLDYTNFLKIAAIFIMVASLTLGYVFIKDNYFGEEVLADNYEKVKSEEGFLEEVADYSSYETSEKSKPIIEKRIIEQSLENKQSVIKPIVQPEKRADEIANQPSAPVFSNEEVDYDYSLKKNEYEKADAQNDDGVEVSAGKKESEDRKVNSQKISAKQSKVLGIVNYQMATYPGGIAEMNKFIKNERKDCFNTTIKTVLTDKAIVKLKLKIKSDGSIKNITVIKPLSEECDSEAIRIIKKMPNWIPANRNGKNVEDEVEIEVNFD